MRAKDNLRSAAEVLVDQLRIHGVKHVFCVPGESYLAVLDAFHDSDLAVTVCRQEGGACMMAEAVGKATGRPGVVFVTRGPGATNASAGIHIAQQDSTPLIMFVGQVARDMREREAFQELDYRAVFGSMTKWATEIDDPARVPELVVARVPRRHQRPAGTGRDRHPRGHADRARRGRRCAAVRADRNLARTGRYGEICRDAWRREGADHAARRQPLVARGLRPGRALRQAICAAGRDDVPPRSSVRPDAPLLRRRCRHRSQSETAGARQIRRSRHPDRRPARRIAVAELYAVRHSAAADAVRARASGRGRTRPRLQPAACDQRHADGVCGGARTSAIRLASPSGDAKAAHADYLAWTDKPTEQPGGVNFGAVMVWLRENLPHDAILCNGAGNYAAWIHRFFRFRRFAQHVAPASGSMGYGVPAAVGDEAALSRAYRGLPRRRRRLSDERPGIRHRRAIRSAVRHRHRRQRHVRHHPHAPGARISRPHFGDRIAQSGFRRLCPRLRRLRHFGRAHRGFSGGVQGGAGVGQAGHRSARCRSAKRSRRA